MNNSKLTGFITNDEHQKNHEYPKNDWTYTHPERPDRVSVPHKYIMETIKDLKVLEIQKFEETLLKGTTKTYMDKLEKLSKQSKEFDGDTYCCPGTVEASNTAVYSNLTMLESIINKEVKNGLVLSRPPGHHASSTHSSGFCIHNNITYVANECLKMGLRPVIVDWDIHHGDGTQKDFYDNPDVLFISIHRDTKTFYPYTGGKITEIGKGKARGTTINIPFGKSKNDSDYLFAVDEVVLPAIKNFKADIILVSCGFDAHHTDPLTRDHKDGMKLTSEVYGQMTERLMSYTDKILVSLEGGYSIQAIKEGSVAILNALQGKKKFNINKKKPMKRTIKKIDLVKDIVFNKKE